MSGRVRTRSPSRSKNPVELLSARNAAGSRPSARARASVVASMKAPAGSSGCPRRRRFRRYRPASAAMPGAPRAPCASASAYSWFGPPRPLPRIVTVSSPPDRIDGPPALRAAVRGRAAHGRRRPRGLRLRRGRRATGIRSPRASRARPRRRASASAGRAMSRNAVPANTVSPGLGDSFAGIVERAQHRLEASRADIAPTWRGHRRAWSDRARSAPSRSPRDRRRDVGYRQCHDLRRMGARAPAGRP